MSAPATEDQNMDREFIGGVSFYRVPKDANGNSRYVVSWLEFGKGKAEAFARAKALGGRVYRGKGFGYEYNGRWMLGGIVFQCVPGMRAALAQSIKKGI